MHHNCHWFMPTVRFEVSFLSRVCKRKWKKIRTGNHDRGMQEAWYCRGETVLVTNIPRWRSGSQFAPHTYPGKSHSQHEGWPVTLGCSRNVWVSNCNSECLNRLRCRKCVYAFVGGVEGPASAGVSRSYPWIDERCYQPGHLCAGKVIAPSKVSLTFRGKEGKWVGKPGYVCCCVKHYQVRRIEKRSFFRRLKRQRNVLTGVARYNSWSEPRSDRAQRRAGGRSSQLQPRFESQQLLVSFGL